MKYKPVAVNSRINRLLASVMIALVVCTLYSVGVQPAAATNPTVTHHFKYYNYNTDNEVGLGAWQKAFTYTLPTVYGDQYGSESSAMTVKIVPMHYQYWPADEEFDLTFGINVRAVVKTGDRNYGGSEPPFRCPYVAWNPPLVIDYAQVVGMLLPIENGQSQQYGANNAQINGAGSNTLRGYYTHDPHAPYEDQWKWTTTGSYQTSDDYVRWLDEVVAKQAEENTRRLALWAIDGITGSLGLLDGRLGAVAGAVNFLLNTEVEDTIAHDIARGYGHTEELSFSMGHGTPWDYNPPGAYSYVCQTNNWMGVAYGGNFRNKDGADLDSVTLRLCIDVPLVEFGGGWTTQEVLSQTIDLVLDKQAWASSYQDSADPLAVEDLAGSWSTTGDASLSWRCNYYTADDDWVKYYLVTDNEGHSWMTPVNVVLEGHYQNNMFSTYQGVDVRRTYTVRAVDASGRQSGATSVTVTSDSTAPTFTQTPSDTTVSVSSPFSLTWKATDTYPDTYEIRRGSSLVASSTWASNAPITYNCLGEDIAGTFYYTCKVSDTVGNSNSHTVKVTVTHPDTTPPVVAIVSPVNGETIKTPAYATYIYIQASASDPQSGITSVEVKVNSKPWVAATYYSGYWYYAPYEASGNPALAYTIQVRAWNGAGLSTTSGSITVYILKTNKPGPI